MSQWAPCKASPVTIEPLNQHQCIVHDEASGTYFRMGRREAHFLEQLDGSHTSTELQTKGPYGFTAEQVVALLDWFRRHGLLQLEGPADRKNPAPWWLRAWRFISHPDLWRLHLVNPDPFLDRYRRYVDALFSRPAWAVYLAILCLPWLLFLARPQVMLALEGAWSLPRQPAEWVLLYSLLLSTTFLHELTHALACKHFGGKVRRIGLMFFYLQPLLYCDVSDSWRFPKPTDRVVVAFAGIFLQLLLSALAMTVWILTGWSLSILYAVFNLFIVVFNLFPLVKLDGYWLLAHYLDQPNLRQKGLMALDDRLRRALGVRRLAAQDKADLVVILFGAGHALAVLLFWALGYGFLLRLAAWLPGHVGTALVTVVTVPLLVRLVRSTWQYARSLMC